MTAAGGGAPAVVTRTGRSSCFAASSLQSITSTVRVRDALLVDQPPDGWRIALGQANVHPARSGHGPREAPAVAVEHRQGPEVDRAWPKAGMHDCRERVQRRAAMGVHHAFRPPCRAARVVDADRVVFAFEAVIGLTLAGCLEERLVVSALAADEHALHRHVLDEMAQRSV